MRQIPLIRLVMDTATETGRGLFRGIAQYNQDYGGWAIWRDLSYASYINSDSSINDQEPQKFDGFIAYINKDDELEYCRSHIKRGIPAVLSLSYQVNSSNVLYFKTDDFAVGRKVAQYFIKNRYQRFAFCGCDSLGMSAQRKAGFTAACAEHGYQVSVFTSSHFAMDRREMESLTKWLISLPKPVAMMTCNDDRGLDVLRACHIANLHVPELVSIVGADNDLITCNMYTPALSSIQFNLEHAGYIAAAQLDHMLRGKKPQVKEILIKPVDVVERQSSNSMAVQDKTVLSAVDFIRLNSAKNLSVENVAQAVSVSRRSLERKFKTILSRSVLEEIQNVRSHKIAQMLTETRLSIMQISLAMGFNGIENISRYFKQTYGMRPSTYRKTLGLPSRSAF